jgi:6-phosphogluconolactonase
MKYILVGFIAFLQGIQAHAQVQTQSKATITQVQKPIANLLIGTYTQKGSKGIYVFNFDTTTGKAIELSHTDSAVNPEFLTITKDKQFVYAVNETKDGMVSAFAFKDNHLNLLQQKPVNAADPCYISLSPDEHSIFVANYNGGSITQFHRFADGLISNAQQFIQHVGKSVNEKRQDKPHVHGAFFSPKGDYVLTPDLGMDQIFIYPYNNNNSIPLDVAKSTSIISKPGSGPRHLAFSTNAKFLYVAEELTGSISVYQFNKGKAIFLQTVLTHNADFKGVPGTADIHVSPNGRYVYVSNRGEENNIAKFPILSNGKLNDKQMQLFSTVGKRPRNFTISKDGNWLLAANQDTDNITVFSINKDNGELINTGNTIKVSMPVCLVLF